MTVFEECQVAFLAKLCLSVIIVNYQWSLAYNFTEINLPEEHIPYYFNSYPEVAEKCKLDPTCSYKVSVDFRHILTFMKPIV
jgi:protein O-GlcNAc transferase